MKCSCPCRPRTPPCKLLRKGYDGYIWKMNITWIKMAGKEAKIRSCVKDIQAFSDFRVRLGWLDAIFFHSWYLGLMSHQSDLQYAIMALSKHRMVYGWFQWWFQWFPPKASIFNAWEEHGESVDLEDGEDGNSIRIGGLDGKMMVQSVEKRWKKQNLPCRRMFLQRSQWARSSKQLRRRVGCRLAADRCVD